MRNRTGSTYPSMREIAEAAGVNQSTVSRALRGDRRISEATRAKVRAAAEALGYRRNPLVSALMETRRRRGGAAGVKANLAFLIWKAGGIDPEREPSLHRIYGSAARRAEQLGFGMELVPAVRGEIRPARLGQMLYHRGVEGLLLSPLPEGEHELELPLERFASVALGESLTTPRLHHVGTDHFATAVQAVRELKRAGYRRIGLFLTREMNERTNRRWLGGYAAETFSESGSSALPPLVLEGWQLQAFQDWRRTHRPDVVLTGHPAAVAHWMETSGTARSGPTLAGLNLNDPNSPFPGVYKDFENLGREAVEILAQLVLRNERGVPGRPQHFLAEGSWWAGRSRAAGKTSVGARGRSPAAGKASADSSAPAY